MKRPSRSRSSKISEAVFRGTRTLYSFEVFPLTAKDVTDAPGVFIISRRRTDKFGSGHHNAVCLGETKSILAEIRHHRKAKCVKQTAANVICFLKEERPEKRLALVEDLAASRKFACIRNEIKTAITALPAIVEFKPVKPKRRVTVPAGPTADEKSAPRSRNLRSKKAVVKGKAAAKKTVAKTKVKPAANAAPKRASKKVAKKAAAKTPAAKAKPARGRTRPVAQPAAKRASPNAKAVAKSKSASRKPGARRRAA